MTRTVIALTLPVLVLAACSPTPYGEPLPAGTAVETSRVSIVVPYSKLRVSLDNPHPGDVVMYEDDPTGLGQAFVFLVQTRSGALGRDIVAELALFDGPDAGLLSGAELLSRESSVDHANEQFLIRIPPLKRTTGPASTIIERQSLIMLGELSVEDGQIRRIQVAWNPLFEDGPGDDENRVRELTRAREALEKLRGSVRFRRVPRAA